MGCSNSTPVANENEPTVGQMLDSAAEDARKSVADTQAAAESAATSAADGVQKKASLAVSDAEKKASIAASDAEKKASMAVSEAEKKASMAASEASEAAASAEKVASETVDNATKQAADALKDDSPAIHTDDFDSLEKKLQAALRSSEETNKLWSNLDNNGNGIVSLAEIDKWVVYDFPLLDHKPALMRAYKKTTLKDGDGDDWVERKEFPALVRNIFYFNKIFKVFDDVDTGDDRSVDFEEFKAGLAKLDMALSEEDAQKEFDAMDKNDGGQVLFDEFCAWVAAKRCPVD